jgi:glycosyltransferase involved in cell wall biosynthesis
MRILFLSHYYPPEVNAPATRTSEHCIRWARAGHDVTVVTCVPNCPTGAAYPGYQNRLRPQVEYVDGVRVVRVWTFLAANAGARRRIVNFLSYLVSAVLVGLRLPRPDVVVATSPQFFCGWAGVLVAWLRRIPFVLEIRDIWPESIQAVGALRGRLFLRLLERLERWMYRAADHIVAVGTGYRDRILLRADVAERISVITNGVDPQRFTLQDADAEFLHTWRLDGRFVCSYIGTIGMAHGLEVVLEAAKLLERQGRKDICFCLVGDGSARQRLEAAAHAAALDELVIFTGQQPKDRIPAILASSNACLVHLKKCELFETVIPSKIFETMAMGRPIIMGVRGPARDIVLESDAGLAMDPESAESLVATVTTLADNPQLTSRLGHSGRQRVLADFNRDVLAGRFLRLMEEMTGEPGTIEFSSDTDQSRKAA